MASEILAVPEEKLVEVIAVIRAGLLAVSLADCVSDETREQLEKWCDTEEAYIRDEE